MRPKSTSRAIRAALLFAALAAMGACNAGSDAQKPPDARPALTDAKIRESLYHARVRDVPDETNTNSPMIWNFMRDEPLELAIVERQMDGDRATVVVDVTTRSAPGARNPRVLSGRLRLNYELETELILRRWEIIKIDNISMKYRDEPKPATEPGTESDGEDGPTAPPPPPPPAR